MIQQFNIKYNGETEFPVTEVDDPLILKLEADEHKFKRELNGRLFRSLLGVGFVIWVHSYYPDQFTGLLLTYGVFQIAFWVFGRWLLRA